MSLKVSRFQVHEDAVQANVAGRTCSLSALEIGGEVLVVLTWLGNKDAGLRRPEYVLPLASVPHQAREPDAYSPYRWILTGTLPMSLFDGSASRQVRRQHGVSPGPTINLPLPSTAS
ncbi:hypothetical protein BLJAPNOD_00122 [Ensifer sp. M14]|uniref:hypothetical protein n=1 Tax=Ensifer sp. M14 TaxID=2203782 RepID=UPI000E1D0BF3|nr:hypothetical protein [Ensifer sp. M14]RDL49026.1 hypothetical protein BLJAPNOD_00122 [Ensifer sp. M14]